MMNPEANEIMIGAHPVGLGHSPYIIAELSANHNGSLDRAMQIVEAAAKAGVDAIKLQTYTPNTMTLDLKKDKFIISDPDSLWAGRSLYSLYEEAYTPWEWHKPIFERCKELGLAGFSTPFDETSLDFLEELDVPCYKISSFENTDLPLIRKICATGKPVIISTGMASLAELDEAVTAAKDSGCTQLVLLKCSSTYPASPSDTNALTIPHMRQMFQCEVGLSDHTKGIGAAIASVALGASMIEKHLTLDRKSGGVDSAFSMEPDEMKVLVEETRQAYLSLGTVAYAPKGKEKDSLDFRRSLYVVKAMKVGEVLTPENLRAIRPGGGLPPKYYDVLLGKKISRDIECGTPFIWDMIG